MPQIISLTATERKFQGRIDYQTFASILGLDVDDLVSPVRFDSVNSVSYFTTRQLKGLNPQSANNLKVEYRVSENLTQIAAQSSKLFKASVVAINGVAKTAEDYVFVGIRVSENLVPTTGGGCKFIYIDDGNVTPSEYEVSDSIASIIAQLTVTITSTVNVQNGLSFAGGSVELGSGGVNPLIHNTEVDLDSFNYDINSTNAGYATSYLKAYNLFTNRISDGLGFDMTEGMATTGYYIKNAASPRNDFDVDVNGNVNLSGGNAIGGQLSIRQRDFTVTNIVDVYNNDSTKHYIRIIDTGVAGSISLGNGTIQANSYTGNAAIGTPGAARFRVFGNVASQDILALTPFAGSGGFQVNDDGSDNPVLYMQDATAATTIQLHTSGNSFLNGGSLSVGNNSPNASAKLDVDSTTKGFLPPRMTTAQRVAIGSPAESLIVYDTDLDDYLSFDGTDWIYMNGFESLVAAASDETTSLTAGTAKVTFRMPYKMKVSSIKASLTTAQASGLIFTVDVNESGATILSTKLTIDNTEKTSTTAATPPVISDSTLANDSEITVDIDQIGDGTATGLKITVIGKRMP